MMVITNGASVKTLKFYYDAEGRPFCFDLDGEIYFYITNLQGDVMQIVSANGSVYGWYEYDAWGKLLTTNGNSSSIAETLSLNPLHYRGYIYDSETEFYYLQSRYYDPTVGRFINSDGQLNGGFLGDNMFAYCENNPVNLYDPYGTDGGVITVPAYIVSALIIAIEKALKFAAVVAGALVVLAVLDYYSDEIAEFSKKLVDTAEEITQYEDQSVYVLVDPNDGDKVKYVGRTKTR